MKTLRTFSLYILMALVLVLAPSIFAQDETFGLSDADFALMGAASAATFESDSLTFDFTAEFTLAGTGEGDISANLSGSGALSNVSEQFQLVVSGDLVSAGETTPLNLEVRLVDGILYFNDGTGWKGQSADDALSEVGSLAGGMTGSDVDPEDIASGDLSGLAGMEGVGEAMEALSSLEPSEFITMSRTDSGDVAQFTTSVSISDLLASPALAPMLMMGLSGGASAEDMEMSAEQMAQVSGMLTAMFAEATVTFDQYIHTTDSLLERVVLDISVPLPDMTGSGQSTTIALNFDASFGGFGEAVSVEAPADAVMEESNGG